ncbi:MAG: hypothetical protein KAS18_11390 [Calditrichia bacterium]|nr:hypothetical protein [Calditrichia bacterium]
MVLTEISAAFTSLKVAADIIKGILSLNKDSTINSKVIELQSVILTLQSELSSMQSKHEEIIQAKSDVEKELIQLKNWETTASQYDLVKLSTGSIVRSPNKNSGFTENEHWLCANCFENQKKSFLQPGAIIGNKQKYTCQNCGEKIVSISEHGTNLPRSISFSR